MTHAAENDAHAPTLYNGRTVCTCGDFNCASLDAENVAPKNTPPSVRRKWRVVDDNGKPLGVWIERFDSNPAYTEAWAFDCIKRYHPGREVQVQTVTTSEWTRVTPPGQCACGEVCGGEPEAPACPSVIPPGEGQDR